MVVMVVMMKRLKWLNEKLLLHNFLKDRPKPVEIVGQAECRDIDIEKCLTKQEHSLYIKLMEGQHISGSKVLASNEITKQNEPITAFQRAIKDWN